MGAEGRNDTRRCPNKSLCFTMASVDDTFETEAMAEILESLNATNIDARRKEYIATNLLPTLFEALPKLLRAVEKNQMELDGTKGHWRYGKDSAVAIKPNQWLAQYLLRNNPKYKTVPPAEDALGYSSKTSEDSSSSYGEKTIEKSIAEKTDASELSSSLTIGQRVRARFAGKGHLYNGKITAINADGTYAIEYDDGDWEDALQEEFIQPI